MATMQKFATSRTVVLLRESAKRKLTRLAEQEKVSSGEIIRRSIDNYEAAAVRARKQEEEKLMELTLGMINESLVAANEALERSCRRLDELHLQLNPEKHR